jgi:hypothetical protein
VLRSGASFTRTSINGPQRKLRIIEIWRMTCYAMGSNAILPHFGLWPFPSGLDVLFGSLHGKEEMAGVVGVLLCKIEETQEVIDSANNGTSILVNSTVLE